jgi:diguanylate cyclase (GGDEF)-like protein/PAS domain S-box-containing protein
MNWSYALALLLTTAAAVAISIVAWVRRSAPGAIPLMWLGGAMAVWMLTYACHFLAITDASRLFWLKLTYLGVLTVPTIFLAYALQYSNHNSWFKRRFIVLFSIEPVITYLLLWTDSRHHLFFGGYQPQSMIYSGGPWFWINVFYSYTLILFAIALLVDVYQRTPRPIRGQTGAILVGAALPLAANLVGLAGWHPFPGLDLIPFAFTITSVCFAIGLSYFHLLDIVPIARDALIERMSDGVMVLDSQNRVVDVNRTALWMLGKEGEKLIGQSAEEALGQFSYIFMRFKDTLILHEEITVGTESPIYLDMNITPLYDRRGRYSGRLVVARDITTRRMAEQAEHEQRVLAEALRDAAAALISSRTFDDVLDRILDNVGRVVSHDLATFMLLDEHGIVHMARSRGYKEHGLSDLEKKVDFPVDEFMNFQTMIETNQALVVSDTSRDDKWVVIEGMEMLRSFVGAPVKVKGKVVGFLGLVSLTADFFIQAHADRLQMFADQVAIAIDNARLIEETKLRAEQMTTLFDIGLVVTSGMDMDRILKDLLEKCRKILPVEAFYIAVYDPGTGMIQHRLFYDMGEYFEIPPRDIHQNPGLSGYIINTGQTLYIPDAMAPGMIEQYPFVHSGGNPTRSFVGVPLAVGEKVVGVISMQSSQPDVYTPELIRLLETIATQTAGVIENVRLFNKVQEELAQRKKVERSLRAANKRLQSQLREIEALQFQLREQAIRDSLTGLYNRRFLEETLKHEFHKAERGKGVVCLIMIDIDEFKAFNDLYSHEAGDLVLSKLGEYLRSEFRSSDISCRFGGEEFLVVMPGTTLERGYERAERIRLGFENLDIQHREIKLHVTLSLGVAAYPQHGATWEDVLHNADQALYLAKGAGKNCTRTATD